MYLMRGERPLGQMIEVETNPAQKVALALFGPIFVPRIPFEPLFFLPLARRVRAAVDLPLVLLGGATSLDDLATARREGFEFIAMGRALLHDPDLPARFERGELTRSGCTPCNICITEMDRPGGVLCAQRPDQLAMRADEVRRGVHLRIAGSH
jgi:2,4-dienoyl-CoA reductase-like NADH-dependent reductase (Old Yellow Enzyme family)